MEQIIIKLLSGYYICSINNNRVQTKNASRFDTLEKIYSISKNKTDSQQIGLLLPIKTGNEKELKLLEFIEELKEIVFYAERKNIKIGIENHVVTKKNKGKLVMIDTYDFNKMFEKIKSDNLFIHLNLGHLKVTAITYGFSKDKFIEEFKDCEIGYSDHTIGNDVPILAVAMGATIIEKHFTLDRKMDGPDHFASIEPIELKKMVESIRNIEKAKGYSKKIITKTELINKKYMRRSIHLAQDITEGDILTLDKITFSRPEEGISVWDYDKIIGKRIIKSLKKGEPLKEENLKWN